MIWLVLAPLVGSVLAWLVPVRATAIGLATSLVTLGTTLAVAGTLSREGPVRYAIGGWHAPLGIDLYADGLAAAMLLMTAVVGTLVGVYAAAYFSHRSGPPDGHDASAEQWTDAGGFWPLWLLLWTALNGLFVSADVFNVYVALELLTLPAIALIILADVPAARTAAMRYLLASFLGSLAYLLGVAVLYAEFGVLDMAALGRVMTAGPPARLALTLMTVGLLLKTALFPLHFWLPRAHGNAPAPVSAILSSLVVKASFYLVARLWFYVFQDAATPMAAQIVGALGAMAVVWGSLQAIRQHRLKLLIANSTVAQVGYLFFLLPLAMAGGADAAWRAAAWDGGIYHALSHGLAKAAMFLSAGTIMHAIGTDRLERFEGLAGQMPITVFAFGLAGIGLIGLPPSGGFVAKWLLLQSALGTGQWWWAAVILAGGVLGGAYILLGVGQTLGFRADAGGTVIASPAPRVMEIVPLILALLALLLGLRATEPLELLQIGSPRWN